MNYRLKHCKKKTSTTSTDYHSWTQAVPMSMAKNPPPVKPKPQRRSSAPDQTLLLSDNPSYEIRQTHLYEEMNGKESTL